MLEVKYITNDKGERTDVVMPLSDYIEILEEIEELKVIDERKGEELFTHSDEKLINSNNVEQRIFEKIEFTYDIKELFSLGLYHKYDKVNREYLDKFEKKGIDLFLFLIGYISDLMKKYFSDSLYVTMLYSENIYKKKLPKETVDNLKYLNINIPKNCIKREYFIPDDEVHNKLFFFEDDLKNINKYLWGLLSRNFIGIEPSLNMEIFFISKDLKTLINVYDDRGMDIIELKIK